MVVLHSGEAPIEPISFRKATSCNDLSARSSVSNSKILWSADSSRDIWALAGPMEGCSA